MAGFSMCAGTRHERRSCSAERERADPERARPLGPGTCADDGGARAGDRRLEAKGRRRAAARGLARALPAAHLPFAHARLASRNPHARARFARPGKGQPRSSRRTARALSPHSSDRRPDDQGRPPTTGTGAVELLPRGAAQVRGVLERPGGGQLRRDEVRQAAQRERGRGPGSDAVHARDMAPLRARRATCKTHTTRSSGLRTISTRRAHRTICGPRCTTTTPRARTSMPFFVMPDASAPIERCSTRCTAGRSSSKRRAAIGASQGLVSRERQMRAVTAALIAVSAYAS